MGPGAACRGVPFHDNPHSHVPHAQVEKVTPERRRKHPKKASIAAAAATEEDAAALAATPAPVMPTTPAPAMPTTPAAPTARAPAPPTPRRRMERVEIFAGHLERTLPLPSDAAMALATCRLDHGVLTVTVPRSTVQEVHGVRRLEVVSQ